MKIKQKIVQVRKRGAPHKADREKVLSNHLRQDQWDWFVAEGQIKGTSGSYELRRGVDWYITAKDTKRANVDGSQLFDDTYKGGDVK